MFELETAIQDWQRRCQAIGSARQEDLLELETHLRDLIVDLQRQGLSDHEAFVVASMRLGPADELEREYLKVHVNPLWRNRIAWMLGGFLAYKVCAAAIGSAMAVGSTLAAWSGMGAAVTGAVSISVSIIGWIVVLLAAYFQSRSAATLGPRVSVATGLLIGLALIVHGGLKAAGQAIQIQLLGASDFGHTVVWQMYGNWLVQAFVLLASFVLLFQLTAKPQLRLTD